jgi:predicted DNA-binding transcriptional regulator AlpA
MATVTIQLTVTFGDDAAATLAAVLAPALREVMADAGRAGAAGRREAHIPLFAGQPVPEDQGLLIDSREVAALLGVSARHLATVVKAGQVPPPIRIGRAVRWSRERITRWVADGCPAVGATGAG